MWNVVSIIGDIKVTKAQFLLSRKELMDLDWTDADILRFCDSLGKGLQGEVTSRESSMRDRMSILEKEGIQKNRQPRRVPPSLSLIPTLPSLEKAVNNKATLSVRARGWGREVLSPSSPHHPGHLVEKH